MSLNNEIYKSKIQYPRFLDQDARDLISQLLEVDPKKRLGSGKGGVEKIKKHPFFEEINWKDFYANIPSPNRRHEK